MSVITTEAPPVRATRVRADLIPTVAAGAFILAWICYFTGRAIYGHFASDEMMNIYYYWSRSTLKLLKGLVVFPSTYYRPMGGVYYSVLFHWFQLNPLPYHIVISSLMALNAWLVWRIARVLSGSALVAGLAALVYCYHADMALAYFAGSLIYDVLCATFWLAALSVYVSGRKGGRQLTWKRITAFLILYICALDAKEMAVTLPVVILVYELAFHWPGAFSAPGWREWVRKTGPVVLIAALMAALYIYGKMTGPDSLSTIGPYKGTYSLHRYVESTRRFTETILYLPDFFTPWRLGILAFCMLYGAIRTRRKDLLVAFAVIVVGPLPITFIPGRGGANLLIPFMGWALFAASAAVGLVRLIAREPAFRRAPRKWVEAALVVILVLLFARMTAIRTADNMPGLLEVGRKTWYAIAQVRTLQPTVKPHSRVIFLSDFFPGFWDMKFVSELVWNDRSVDVTLQQYSHLPDADVQRFDYIFTTGVHGLVRLKPAVPTPQVDGRVR